METKLYSEASIQEAALKLRQGAVIAFPTETVYGLGANALLKDSVQQVFKVKGRPSDNPMIVHIAEKDQLNDYVDNFHPLTEKIVNNFWPGPLTLIFNIKKGSLPAIVTGGLSTAAFRMPNHKKTLALIKAACVPIVGPSANTSGKPSPTTAQHVYHDMAGKIAGIFDDGPTAIGVESTVLDISNNEAPPMILRPGAVTQEELEQVLQVPVALDRHLVTEAETPKSPGMKYKHYAPNTPVMIVKKESFSAAIAWGNQQGKQIGLLATPTVVAAFKTQVADAYAFQGETVAAATQGLFAGLRALDEAKRSTLILAEAFPEENLGTAYMNRLKKAAGENFFEHF